MKNIFSISIKEAAIASTNILIFLTSIGILASPANLQLPPETVVFIPGPKVELANAKCLICHSADYILTQPPSLNREAWNAIILKMKNKYGAPISENELPDLVNYFVKSYGNEKSSAVKGHKKSNP